MASTRAKPFLISLGLIVLAIAAADLLFNHRAGEPGITLAPAGNSLARSDPEEDVLPVRADTIDTTSTSPRNRDRGRELVRTDAMGGESTEDEFIVVFGKTYSYESGDFAPVGDCEVSAHSAPRTAALDVARTDESGRFRLSIPPEALGETGLVWLESKKDGYMPALIDVDPEDLDRTMPSYDQGPGMLASNGLILPMDRCGYVRGRVVESSSGRGVSGVAIDLIDRDPAADAIGPQRSKRDGEFVVFIPRDAEYQLHAYLSGTGSARSEWFRASSTEGVELAPLWLEGAGVLSGRVLSLDGLGVSGLRVEAVARDFEHLPERALLGGEGNLGAEAVTDENGGFRIGGLRNGDYQLSLCPGDQFCSPVGVYPSLPHAEIRVEAEFYRLTVDVTMADGAPGAELSVDYVQFIEGEGKGLRALVRAEQTDANGRVQFWTPHPGEVLLKVQAAESSTFDQRVVIRGDSYRQVERIKLE